MTDMETVLSSRLHSLAEELTPGADPLTQVDSARALFRHRRRARAGVALAAAAVVAVVVGVSSVTGALSSAPDPGRDGAGPGPVTASGTVGDREDSGRIARWQDTVDQRAERDARLDPLAERLRAALRARPTPLSLDGPSADEPCPERAPTVDSAFGAVLAEHSSGAAAGDCVWLTPDGVLQVTLGFMADGTIDQIHADVDAEDRNSGCYPTALPGSLTFTALALCEEDGAMGWHIRVMDTSGSGFWLLTVTVGDAYPGDGPTTVAAVLDAADADL
jgi:hypothetical protein